MRTISEEGKRAELVPACRCEVTRRGPNWLFVHIDAVGVGCGLEERLWRLADQQFTYRVVLEFDDAEPADPRLGIELGKLCRRLREQGGALRLCGLTPAAAEHVLTDADCPPLHNHVCDHDAVWGGPAVDGPPADSEPTPPAPR